MTITVDTRLSDRKITYIAENVTVDLTPTIERELETIISSLTPTDIENLQKAENVRRIHEAMINLGLTIRDL